MSGLKDPLRAVGHELGIAVRHIQEAGKALARAKAEARRAGAPKWVLDLINNAEEHADSALPPILVMAED